MGRWRRIYAVSLAGMLGLSAYPLFRLGQTLLLLGTAGADPGRSLSPVSDPLCAAVSGPERMLGPAASAGKTGRTGGASPAVRHGAGIVFGSGAVAGTAARGGK